MTPSQQTAKLVAAAYALGMTYDQIIGMVKTQCALHEHATR